MPIEWTVDTELRCVRITLAGSSLESEYIALVRGVATVTNGTGGYAILVDVHALAHIPGYAEIVRLCQEVWRVRSPEPDFIALIAPEAGALYGKARQAVAILATLGLEVDLFESESEALAWAMAKQSGVASR